jgi:hypothetical protein
MTAAETHASDAYIVDPRLADFASDRQKEYIAAVNLHGSYKAAARALGVSHDRPRDSIETLKKKAASEGYAPGHWVGGTAPGYILGKVTTHVKDGKVVEYWPRQHPEASSIVEQLREFVEGLKEDVPKAAPAELPVCVNDELCTLYPVTDYHFGMQAHASDSDAVGADWNLEIAEETLVRAITYLSAKSNSGTAILALMGDLLHFDGPDPVTPTHRHPLDADGRQRRVVRTVVRALRRVVQILLEKHGKVRIVVIEGNHDLSSTPWLREILLTHYEAEPRVDILDCDLPYQAIAFGVNFLGFSHGHKRKKESLPMLFAAMFRELWGRTKVGHIHTGHYHSGDEKDHPGIRTVQHRTLAAPDSHSTRGGWFSEREMAAFHYHAQFGPRGRDVVTPEMVMDDANRLGIPTPTDQPTNKLGLFAA